LRLNGRARLYISTDVCSLWWSLCSPVFIGMSKSGVVYKLPPFDSSKVLHMECGSEDPQSDFIKIYGPWNVFGGAYINRSTVIYTQHTMDMTSNPDSMHLHCPGYSMARSQVPRTTRTPASLARWPLSHKGSESLRDTTTTIR
jgi:hypothetical protein